MSDPSYGETELRRNANLVALLIQHFWQRWRQEYLTSLRDFHKARGTTGDTTVKVGDVVQIHSDEGSRLKWRLGVVEGLIRGANNAVRAVHLRTSKGCTNRPITKLYPLEVVAEDPLLREQIVDPVPPQQLAPGRSQRIAALGAKGRIADWARQLCVPPEDV